MGVIPTVFTVFVVDEDSQTRSAVRNVAAAMNLDCEEYASGHQSLPVSLAREFRVSLRTGGEWQPWQEVTGNCLRHRRFPLGRPVSAVRVERLRAGGDPAEPVRLFRLSLA